MSVPHIHKIQFQRQQAAPLKPEGHVHLDPWEPTVADFVRQVAGLSNNPLRPLWWTPAFVELEVPAEGSRPGRQFQIVVWVQPNANGHQNVVAQLSTIEMFT